MSKKNKSLIQQVEGQGGKGGGGGGGAVEAKNTLQSSSIVRILELLSEGEIEGVVGGFQGAFLNDTPIENPDGSRNFQRVSGAQRYGLPSQPYMEGFPSAEAEVGVGIQVKKATAAVKTVSSANVDAVRVTIQLPNGLSKQDTKTGNLNGHLVDLAIDTKLSSSGTWSQFGDVIRIEGKTTSSYEAQYFVGRPSGAGLFDVRVRRVSEDPENASERNETTFARLTEIQDLKLEYPDCAYVGLAVDAESVGGSIPRRSYLVRGIKCHIPTNYDPVAATYAGAWDGSFKVAWTNNPAWILYELLVNERFGMGEFVKAAQIDKFSFYDAGRYNDVMVPDWKEGMERRFTFDTPIVQRGEAIKLLQNIAGAFRSTLVYSGGLLSVNQDRPSDAVKLVTNANVIGGKFTRSSTAKNDRHTAVNITWNDKADRYLPKVSTIQYNAAIDRLGFNVLDTAAYGATTEGQAIRNAKWILDTELRQSSLIKYETSLTQFDLRIGDVIKVYDQHYTIRSGAGRIRSATTTSVTLDRDVVVDANSTLDVTIPSAAGPQFVTRAISNAPGTHRVLNLATPLPAQPRAKADYIVTSGVAPQLFRVMSISQQEANIITVEALQYDPNKFNRIETDVETPAPAFSAVNLATIGPPTDLKVTRSAMVTSEGIRRNLLLTWQPPDLGVASSYAGEYRYNGSNPRKVEGLTSCSVELENIAPGFFEFTVYSVNVLGKRSAGASLTYTLSVGGEDGLSELVAPANMQVVGGGTNFIGQDLTVEWTNPLANERSPVPLKDFRIRVYDADSNELIRTNFIAAVPAGEKVQQAYPYSINAGDPGGPRRKVKVAVEARDTDNNTSLPTIATFTNPAPAVLTSFQLASNVGGTVTFIWDKPDDADYKGVLIWAGEGPNFPLNQASLVWDGDATSLAVPNVDPGKTYWVRAAAYDAFGKSYTGAGLNLSPERTTGRVKVPGVWAGTEFPENPEEGESFFRTDRNSLYFFHNGKWERVGIEKGDALPAEAEENDAFVLNGDIYFYRDGKWERPGIQMGDEFPTAPKDGAVFIKDKTMYMFVGGAWERAGVRSGATLPAEGQDGDTFIKDGKLYVYSGGAFRTSGIPSGSSLPTSAQDGDAFMLNGVMYGFFAGQWRKPGIESGAALPSSGNEGDPFIKDGSLFIYQGGAWKKTGVPSGATLPSNGNAGDLFTNTSTGKLYRYVGGAWTAAVPAVDITGQLAGTQIAAGTITANNIAAGTITGDRIYSNSITGSQIAGSTITGAHIAGQTITGNNIYGGTITGSHIAGGTITASNIASQTITGDKIYSNTITGSHISGGTITGSHIAGYTISGYNIAGNTISGYNIQGGTITGGHIQGNSITGDKIATNTLTAAHIYGQEINGVNIVGSARLQVSGSGKTWDCSTAYGPLAVRQQCNLIVQHEADYETIFMVDQNAKFVTYRGGEVVRKGYTYSVTVNGAPGYTIRFD